MREPQYSTGELGAKERPQGDGDREGPGGVVIIKLAQLPERAILDERALAAALGVSKRTVRRMVGRYELPPPISFSGRSAWQVGKVLAWFEARAERAARDAERNARRLDGMR